MSVYSDNTAVFRNLEKNAYKEGYLAALDAVLDGMQHRRPYELGRVVETLRELLLEELRD